jgi:cyclic beta-1,2-glucan synthetase
MGSGDWNDGMNRVGAEGRGESVWLAWLLCRLIDDFAPLADQRGDLARAQRWHEAAQGWRVALRDHAWDGQWYRRAYFDDGTPLGTHTAVECRIDLIAQAWSVISGVAPPAYQRLAMDSVDAELVDHRAGLIKLLTPPLQEASPSAGYIQAYPKGVRENGGQYSHAGAWAVIAHALRGDGDAAYRYFCWLSPAHRAADPAQGPVYAIEPYAMAGDVYAEAPYVGRGGWSWYTGSAAWMHRAAIEHLFGLRQQGGEVAFEPCLPSRWEHAELTLKRGGRTLRVVFCQPDATARIDAALRDRAVELGRGQTLRWDQLAEHATCLVRLPDRATPAPRDTEISLAGAAR